MSDIIAIAYAERHAHDRPKYERKDDATTPLLAGGRSISYSLDLLFTRRADTMLRYSTIECCVHSHSCRWHWRHHILSLHHHLLLLHHWLLLHHGLLLHHHRLLLHHHGLLLHHHWLLLHHHRLLLHHHGLLLHHHRLLLHHHGLLLHHYGCLLHHYFLDL